ncbi:MAG: DUF4139 domain-containing protein [Alphaproteobacteria bacterium]|nr:DUF4139 domain-containing protein [Alphaproteobacteria bacterium]
MRIPRSLVVVAVATPLTCGSGFAGDLALKRAVLGTGGVGYFEYAAEVSGQETLTLRTKLDQVDDILASMVILDPAGPALATLPSQAGADQAFASLPFSKSDLDTLPALLAALKGAEISLSGPRAIEGRIVSVAAETAITKGNVETTETTHTRVSVLANGAIEQFILEEAQGLQFKDARLAEQMDSAIRALRAAQDRSGRDITIRLAPGGSRIVRIGYVAEAPVWKAAYRMTLPRTGEDKARLEGWVVLENMTGNPWKDVAVTLSSASPVTFRQELYNPYYVKRPVNAPPVSRTAQAPVDHGIMAAAESRGPTPSEPATSPLFDGFVRGAPPPAAPPPAPMSEPRELGTETSEDMAGASFTLATPVTVPSGESLTVPFIDLKVPAQTAAWYRGGRNPWRALSLKNDSPTSLPPGAVTVYEETSAGPLFSGDAQFPLLPAGDSRLVGFAADQKVLVDSERGSASALTSVRAVNGALHIESRLRQTTTYRIKNGSAEPRQLTIEQPRITDWTLVEPKPEQAAIAEKVYRLRFDVDANQSREVKVVMERPTVEIIDVAQLTDIRVRAIMIAPEITEETRNRLAPVAEATKSCDEAKAEVDRLQKQRKHITDDQERLRQNLKAAPQGSDLARLYAQKMLTQEKALEESDESIKQARNRLTTAQKLLAERVRAL